MPRLRRQRQVDRPPRVAPYKVTASGIRVIAVLFVLATGAALAHDASADLATRFGVGPANTLLASSSANERLRGIERLAAIGTPEAIDKLVDAAGAGGVAHGDARARLLAMRRLVAFVAKPKVLEFFALELRRDPVDPLGRLEQSTSAMALAAAREPNALALLVGLVQAGGERGDMAEQALLAYPPPALGPITDGKDALDANVCRWLGRLGDLRAIEPLRTTLARARAERSLASQLRTLRAALALAQLGDGGVAPLAREWLASADPWLALAGARVLAELGGHEGVPVVAALLTRTEPLSPPELRDELVEVALSLAWQSADRPLLQALATVLEKTDDARLRARLLVTLAHANLDEAIDVVARHLETNDASSPAAAFALAQSERPRAGEILARALADPRLGALAARAAVVRILLDRSAPQGLDRALDRMVRSANATERAAAAFGLVALGHGDPRTLFSSSDAVMVRAAARAAPLAGSTALSASAERLYREHDPATRVALSLALAYDPASADAIATSDLRRWVDAGERLAPLAVRALGSRDGERLGPVLDEWLAAPDPTFRLHGALGLADSNEPTAIARLATAYRFEPEPSVRRAIVRALARLGGGERSRTLDDAALLDPDTATRVLARRVDRGSSARPTAVSGDRPSARQQRLAEVSGSGPDAPTFAWLALERTAGPFPPGAVELDDGRILPVVPDPDGLIVVGPIGSGPFRFTPWFDLASDEGRAKSSVHAAQQSVEPARR